MILETENVVKSFGKKKVLRGASFGVEAGTLIGLVGENGSGKSTLLKIIVGEWKADAGKITREGKVGYCPQQSLIFPQLTVAEHFRYFSVAYGLPKSDWKPQSERLLRHFNFEKYSHEKVSELSGGTQQKLNLSLSLLHQPALLILDEPYSGFDWDTYLRFWALADEMREQGCGILIVTHLLSETERFDRILHLEEGRLN